MNKTLIDVELLIKELKKRYNVEYELEFVEIGSHYNFGFIRVKECHALSISMDDYDGWDNFGDEDNDLELSFQLNNKYHEDIKDTNARKFISHSIKETRTCHAYGVQYIEYDQLKDWCVFKDIDINDVTTFATLDIHIPVNLNETEIEFMLDLAIKNNMQNLVKELLNAKKIVQYKDKSVPLNELNPSKLILTKSLKQLIKNPNPFIPTTVAPPINSNISDNETFEL